MSLVFEEELKYIIKVWSVFLLPLYPVYISAVYILSVLVHCLKL